MLQLRFIDPQRAEIKQTPKQITQLIFAGGLLIIL